MSRVLPLALLFFVSSIGLAQDSDSKSDNNGSDSQQAAKVQRAMKLGKIEVDLKPQVPSQDKTGPRWSPKGSQIPLQSENDQLTGTLKLGERASFKVAWQLGEQPRDPAKFGIDLDRDGEITTSEWQPVAASDNRGSFWYSVKSELAVPMEGNGTRPYPVNLWFVIDPAEPDADPIMRWSRRGWHEGTFDFLGQTATLVVTEYASDGVFNRKDSWGLGTDQRGAYANSMAGLKNHAWLDGVAFRILDIDSDATRVTLEAFDPGFTQAEEKERNDPYAADKKLKRAEKPIEFLHDLDEAIELAKREQKLLFVDFETTWCGPCKMMDRYVYSAQPVADAVSSFVAVKLDGDEEKETVKELEVAGYPTMLVITPAGEVLSRKSGYTSAAKLIKFLNAASEKK